MFNLDLRSIILMTGIMSLLLSVVMLFQRRSYPASIKGLGEWAAAPAVLFVASILFGVRGMIPDMVSVLFANLLLLTGISLFYFGSQRFFGLPVSIRPWGGALLAAIPVLAWFTLAEPSYRARLMVVLFLLGYMMLAHARLVWRHGGPAFSFRFTVVVLLVQAGVIILRFMAALTLPSGDGLFNGSPIQTLYIASNAFITVTLCIGLMLMASDRLRAELEHLATHDRQTGVLTRGALIDTCEQELERCHRHGRTMSLLMMDLDHFKAINDTHGHLMGDRVILNFVGRVAAQLRRPDQLGRYGGEEFVVLLPETSLEEAVSVAERIRTEVAIPSGLPVYTVSIGVTASRSDDDTVDGLLGRADNALYKAKAAGRNLVAAT